MPFERCRCDECPLKKHWEGAGSWRRVDFEDNDTGVVVLGSAPSKIDTELECSFADGDGAAVLSELKDMGMNRHSVSWGTTIACRWPDDDPKMFLSKLRSVNRKRKAKGNAPYISPIEACAGHRKAKLRKYETVITLGPIAAKTMLEGNPSLEDVRGGPARRNGQKVLPTYHPRAVNKTPKLRPVFRSDLEKAFRHHNDTLRWEDPKVYFSPSVAFVEEFFNRARAEKWMLTYDVETDGIDALNADLRCIGIGTEKEVLILGFISIDGETRFYSPEDEERIKCLLREVFDEPGLLVCGHNAGYFDRLVVEQHLGVTPAPLLDTILLHKLAASEHRHSLAFISSVMLDTPAWKASHTAVTARTDNELHAYCATDVAATAHIARQLKKGVATRNQLHLYETDAKVQALCAGMRRLGIRIDEGRRFDHEQTQIKEAAKWLNILHQYAPDLNPNSNAQIRGLLFDRWGLPVQEYTATGDESVSAAVLRSLVGSPLVEDSQKDFINALRFYRRAQKLLTTYLLKLAPGAGVVKDGYVYPDYNAHGTITGRLSSSNPNFQNIPYNLRNIFIPPDGCVFVGADYDQLELRFASALAGADHYLDAFEKQEIDPHNLTADLMFGNRFWEAAGAPETQMGKGSKDFKQLRNLAKTICFASLYGASAPKVHEIISRAEDRDGTLLYAHYNLRQIRALHKRWLQKAPEFKAWWHGSLNHYRQHGYVKEMVLGRRRYFAYEDYNAILNFGVQAGSFNIVALSMLELVDKHIPFDFGQKTGLCNQLHDAVLFAVPETEADYMASVITDVLTRQIDGLPVTFTAKAEIGENWREV
jgi:DNA polymerase-1